MMNPRKWIARILVVGALGSFAAGAIAPTASSPSTALAADVALGAGGEFHPLSPTRIFDTRGAGIFDTAPLGRKPTSAAGQSFNVDILGRGGIPATPTDVLAVVAQRHGDRAERRRLPRDRSDGIERRSVVARELRRRRNRAEHGDHRRRHRRSGDRVVVHAGRAPVPPT